MGYVVCDVTDIVYSVSMLLYTVMYTYNNNVPFLPLSILLDIFFLFLFAAIMKMWCESMNIYTLPQIK